MILCLYYKNSPDRTIDNVDEAYVEGGDTIVAIVSGRKRKFKNVWYANLKTYRGKTVWSVTSDDREEWLELQEIKTEWKHRCYSDEQSHFFSRYFGCDLKDKDKLDKLFKEFVKDYRREYGNDNWRRFWVDKDIF